MTKSELIKKLEPYPGNMEVFLAERKTDFGFGLLDSVNSKEVPFMEEPGGKAMAKDTVIILDEE